MAATQHLDRMTFLKYLRESNLLDPLAVEEALRDAPPTERGRVLARHLVQKGLLTRFQGEQLLAGRTSGFFLGQYRILDMIGRGGMGKVFKAEHLTMDRVVALKVLGSEFTRTERARSRFVREVRAAAKLVHPNIVTAFDANEVEGRFFLVMEYIAGPNLSALLKSQGPLPVGLACEFMRQAALGLQHAFELGLVHRDIKPSNLMVQPPAGRTELTGATIKITDFGLARLNVTQSETEDQFAAEEERVMGTPDFLSPEQGRGLHGADIRSDLYSLGCTFYCLLTGQVPFPGGSALDKLVKHESAQAEPVELLRPATPPGVAVIVRRLMAKNPDDRFPSPIDLARALEPFSQNGPVGWQANINDSLPALSSVGGTFDTGLSFTGAPPSALSATHPLADLPTYLTPADVQSLRTDPDNPETMMWVMWLLLALGVSILAAAVLIATTMFS